MWIDLFGEFLKRVLYQSVCVWQCTRIEVSQGLAVHRSISCIAVPSHKYIKTEADKETETQWKSNAHAYTFWHFGTIVCIRTHTETHIHTPTNAGAKKKHQTKRYNWHNNKRTNANIAFYQRFARWLPFFWETQQNIDCKMRRSSQKLATFSRLSLNCISICQYYFEMSCFWNTAETHFHRYFNGLSCLCFSRFAMHPFVYVWFYLFEAIVCILCRIGMTCLWVRCGDSARGWQNLIIDFFLAII